MAHDDIERLFTYRRPDAAEVEAMGRINDAIKAAAHAIDENAPPGADQKCALRHLVDARMTANKAIIHRSGPLEGTPAQEAS